MKRTVVLYPGLAASHFTPMVELADVFLDHGYAVTVVLINPSVKEDDAAFTAVVARAVSSKTSISFHMLPRIPDPPSLAFNDRASTPSSWTHRAASPLKLRGSWESLSWEFYPSDAGGLAVNLQVPLLIDGFKKHLGGDTTPVEFLGVPPMSGSHLASLFGPIREVNKDLEAMMFAGARGTAEFDGILINTSVSLENRALRALADPRCCPGGAVLPPVYAMGPLVDKAGAAGDDSSRHECLVWLDGQPDRSVVFLCFGSIADAGNLAEQQLREIAAGLDKSGHRFMWVVRRAPSTEHLDALGPEGFLARTSGRGVVVNSWVPQPSILRHRATAAFVTHCGLRVELGAGGDHRGVPMLCWPLYSEQRINKVLVVEDMGVGVEMEGWLEGLVTASEVEAKVRLVMESEKGRKLRERVEAHREAAAMALNDGGSSRAAFAQLLSDIDDAHGKQSSASV
uniref:Glycosyltransferase n=1 Tax=Oryza punctata TaxID=4537 RepID=A0A0E0M2N7_ORYPU